MRYQLLFVLYVTEHITRYEIGNGGVTQRGGGCFVSREEAPVGEVGTVCTERSISETSDVSVRDRVRFYGCRLGNKDFGRCGSGNCDNGGAIEPRLRRLLASVHEKRIRGIVICGLSQVDHSVLSFSGVVGLFRRCRIRFISSARGFSASAPVKQTVLGVYVIFTRLRHRAVRGHIDSTCCSEDRGNFQVNNGPPCNCQLRRVLVRKVRAGGLIRRPKRTTVIQRVFSVCRRPSASCKSVAECCTRGKIRFCKGRLVHSVLTRLLEGPMCIQTSVSICHFFEDRKAGVMDDPRRFSKVRKYCLCRKQSTRASGLRGLGNRVLIITPRRKLISSRR